MDLEENDEKIKELKENEDKAAFEIADRVIAEIEKLKDSSEEPPEESDEEAEDESVESESDEEAEDEDEEQEEQRKPEKEEKIWKLKKRKYQALAEKVAALKEKEAVLRENEQLKQMLSESLNSGTYHLSRSAYSELERAKEAKKQALLEGDADALINADIEIARALNTVSDVEKWAYNEPSPKQKYAATSSYPEQPSNKYNELEQEIAADWLENHPYLQPDSPKYNSKIATKVANFVNHLDADLMNGGQGHQIFSNAYFTSIDQYIEKVKNDSSQRAKNREGSPQVGGVKNSYAGSSNNKNSSKSTKVILTPDEKFWADMGGITHEDYLKAKINDLKKGKK
jgi:DNA repair exonuclease SbcCD ATPase subunit